MKVIPQQQKGLTLYNFKKRIHMYMYFTSKMLLKYTSQPLKFEEYPQTPTCFAICMHTGFDFMLASMLRSTLYYLIR